MCRFCVSALVAALILAGLAPSGRADSIKIAYDQASNYTNWTGDEGVGLDTWVLHADGGGTFLADGDGDLNSIATDGKAWGTWANDGGGGVTAQYVAAFRGFGWNGSGWDNRLEGAGDIFKISFEHDIFTKLNASCGFAIRNGNVDFGPSAYDAGARFQFGLYSDGTAIDLTYAIYDGSGAKLDTGVSKRDSGLDLVLTLTSTNSYTLGIYDATNQVLITNIVSTLAGSGTLDSLSLFNRDTDTAGNVYFNKIEIWRHRAPALLIVK